MLTEFTCPDEINIHTKYIEKRTKYNDLLFEVRKTYDSHEVKLVVLLSGTLVGVLKSL